MALAAQVGRLIGALRPPSLDPGLNPGVCRSVSISLFSARSSRITQQTFFSRRRRGFRSFVASLSTDACQRSSSPLMCRLIAAQPSQPGRSGRSGARCIRRIDAALGTRPASLQAAKNRIHGAQRGCPSHSPPSERRHDRHLVRVAAEFFAAWPCARLAAGWLAVRGERRAASVCPCSFFL